MSFNVLHPNGSYVGYDQVEEMAALRSIQLRTGCHCNLGACRLFLEQSHEVTMRNYEAGHICGDKLSLVAGLPTGVVRVSFGFQSTEADIETLVRFLSESFAVAVPPRPHFQTTQPGGSTWSTGVAKRVPTPVLARMIVYPIKSCPGIEVDEWLLNPAQVWPFFFVFSGKLRSFF